MTSISWNPTVLPVLQAYLFSSEQINLAPRARTSYIAAVFSGPHRHDSIIVGKRNLSVVLLLHNLITMARGPVERLTCFLWRSTSVLLSCRKAPHPPCLWGGPCPTRSGTLENPCPWRTRWRPSTCRLEAKTEPDSESKAWTNSLYSGHAGWILIWSQTTFEEDEFAIVPLVGRVDVWRQTLPEMADGHRVTCQDFVVPHTPKPLILKTKEPLGNPDWSVSQRTLARNALLLP